MVKSVCLIGAVHVFEVINKYQVGRTIKQKGSKEVIALKDMLHLQIAFSLGLALLIYLKNEVTSTSATIIANKVYSRSL